MSQVQEVSMQSAFFYYPDLDVLLYQKQKTAVHELVQMEWNTDQKVDRRDEIRI